MTIEATFKRDIAEEAQEDAAYYSKWARIWLEMALTPDIPRSSRERRKSAAKLMQRNAQVASATARLLMGIDDD